MEYFYSSGGNPTPDFVYRFLVKEATEEMYDWLSEYPLYGPFDRWYIKRRSVDYKGGTQTTIQVQIENRKAAYMFMLAFSEYITENKSIYEITP